jgi:hypothetical protein
VQRVEGEDEAVEGKGRCEGRNWKGSKICSLSGKCAAIMLYRAVMVSKCNDEVRLWIRARLVKILIFFIEMGGGHHKRIIVRFAV